LTVIVQHENFERKEIYGGIFFIPAFTFQSGLIALKALSQLPSAKKNDLPLCHLMTDNNFTTPAILIRPRSAQFSSTGRSTVVRDDRDVDSTCIRFGVALDFVYRSVQNARPQSNFNQIQVPT